MMEIKYAGKYKSPDSLFEEARDNLVDAIYELSERDQFTLGNLFREYNRENPLYRNTEENINDLLDHLNPYDILQLDYDQYSDYFGFEYGEMECTDDPLAGVDIEDVADAILEEEFNYGDLPFEIQEVLDEYLEAKEKLDSISQGRKLVANTLHNYLNNKADVGDLLITLSRLMREDDLWGEEN